MSARVERRRSAALRCSESKNDLRGSSVSAKSASCASGRSERRRRPQRVVAAAAASEAYGELVPLCVQQRVQVAEFLEVVVSICLVF